ncbi:RNA polymerase sigma factor [Neolewinella lacunae]|uniref:RNA polymerase sigma factor n=1 Tax=Neolewinella lacunae TaxID=1517758 RepID=A0A923PMD0_9BACT|nr:RNA polymerase sigma factor [Neolewinella lacunae]MBC6995090.1 RNA polymerase sigma factor [Neolewinella lacunae]MDN3634040.1 RNA polymerase sigma factor [Neolewinella lacunae]
MLTVQELKQMGQEHLPEFRALALQLTADRDAAEDLLQDTIFLILKYRDQFEAGSNFSAWVKTIIRNTFITDYRKKKRRKELLDKAKSLEFWTGDRITYNQAESSLGAEEIMGLIEALPSIYRRAFQLFCQGMKYQEIALLTGVPIGTAKSRVFTARQELKKQLSQRGVHYYN